MQLQRTARSGHHSKIGVFGAFLALIGLQLFISWILMRVLEALSEREVRISQEMARATP